MRDIEGLAQLESLPCSAGGLSAQQLTVRGWWRGGRAQEWLRPQSDPAPRSQEWAEGLRATQRGVWNSWPIGSGAP